MKERLYARQFRSYELQSTYFRLPLTKCDLSALRLWHFVMLFSEAKIYSQNIDAARVS